jgi:tRNA/tmRNA/rRNA uracil-C5-methylase (TrmA/RlmC/RlmD family)
MERTAPADLKVGMRVEVDIGPVAHGGHFVARHNGQVIFVRHAITGERAVVEITSISSRLARGDAIEILEASKDRVVAPCKYAVPGGCGGCDFQHVEIGAQLELKRAVIREQFSRLARMDIDLDVLAVAPEDGLHWRSRMDFAISKNGKLGLFSSRSNEITEIESCQIALDAINDPVIFDRTWKGEDRLEVAVSNSGERNVSRGGRSISGPTQLHEKVGEFTYEISPTSFWQAHVRAPETLMKLAIDLLALRPGDHACDLYGGVGLFTAPMLEEVGDIGRVHLIESSHRATQDALRIFDGKKNLTIHSGRVEQKLPLVKRADVILLDPPRTGAGEMVVKEMLAKSPRVIVYVSCDPASLARDAKALEAGGYHLDHIVGFDLFPMTHHVECVARFSRG